MRNDGAAEFGHGHHSALDMHMRVAQTWNQVAPFGLDNDRAVTDRVGSVRPAIGKATAAYSYIRAGHDFSGMDVDPTAAPHHEVRLLAACCNIHQFGRHFRPRSRFFHAFIVLSRIRPGEFAKHFPL